MKNKLINVIGVGVLILSMGLTGCSMPGKSKDAKVEYPTKQVELIVPAAAGGGSDILSRAIADYVSKDWGKPVVVVNKPGTSGSQEALQSKPDGYTVLATSPGNSSMMAGVNTNPVIKLEDHRFIARVLRDPIGFVVKADAPWKNVKEFSDWALKNPDQLIWTSPGAAQTSAFSITEWYKSLGGDIKKTHMVTTTGGSDSVTKIAGGNAILNGGEILSAIPMTQAGKVKILAVSRKHPYFPDIPTFAEAGLKEPALSIWLGFSMPKGAPDYAVKKWEDTLSKMVKDQEFLEKCKSLKTIPDYQSSADFEKFIKDETSLITDLATQLGIRK
ncbi:MAG: transporter [Clostridiales bacterium]|nr:transporter [Clostridiales bacterium]